MVLIGQPQVYETPKPVEKQLKPKTEEEFYQALKQLFLEECTTKPGPWRLTKVGLKMLCVTNKLKTSDDELTDVWKRMVKDVCHEDLILPARYDFVEKLKEIDDCMDVIYAIGESIFLGDKVRILY